MNDLSKRIGIIKITANLISDNPEDLLKMFQDILVTDVKIDFDGIRDYKGISKHFDILKEGEKIPYYDIEITNDNGKLAFKYIRQRASKE